MEILKYNEHEFRIKRMNAIELSALRSQVNFDTTEDAMKCYNSFLERIEVHALGDKWISVKSGDLYYPAGIEDDMTGIETLIQYFMEYMKEVFQKSNESKETIN